MHIKKAILPIAGKGSRIAPISNFIPKEMLPIFDRPLIHYAIEEAINAGIEEFILVTRPSKHMIAEYIEKEFGNSGCKFSYINQTNQNGLGGAILCANNFIAQDDIFAVILPDDLIINSNCLNEMIDIYQAGNMVAVDIVSKEEAKKYGILKPKKFYNSCIVVDEIVEKPQLIESNKNYAVVGRYLLTWEVMDELKRTNPGTGGEIQISDALTSMAKNGVNLNGYEFNGKKIDCGSKEGWVLGILSMAMQNESTRMVIKNFIGER